MHIKFTGADTLGISSQVDKVLCSQVYQAYGHRHKRHMLTGT